MGPSPTWLYLLIIACFVTGNTFTFFWLRRRVGRLGRRILTAYWLGTITYLMGMGLQGVGQASESRPHDLAFFFKVTGLGMLLLVVASQVPSFWRKRFLRPTSVPDAVAKGNDERYGIAILWMVVSMSMPEAALDPLIGVPMGVVALFAAFVGPLLYWVVPAK